MPTYTDRGLPLYSDTEAMPGWHTSYNAQSTALDTALDNLEADSHDDASVATIAAIPTTGNWVGRTLYVEEDGRSYTCTGLPGTWVYTEDLADTGWIATGVLSASAGWTIVDYRIRRIGKQVHLMRLHLTRSGSSISGGADGNITNVSLADISGSTWQPASGQSGFALQMINTGSLGSAYISSGTTIMLGALATNSVIATSEAVIIAGSWWID